MKVVIQRVSEASVTVKGKIVSDIKQGLLLLLGVVEEDSKEDIDWLVPHQANMRIISATAKKLNMSMDRVIITVDQHGNTSAASVPLALDVAVRDGRIKVGDTILLEAFGGGFTWGSILLRY